MPPTTRDRADAAHVLEPLLQHLRGPGGELLRRCACRRVGQHGDVEDRLRSAGSKRETRGSFTSSRSSGRISGDLLAHVVGGLAAVDVELELDDDDRGAFVASASTAS